MDTALDPTQIAPGQTLAPPTSDTSSQVTSVSPDQSGDQTGLANGSFASSPSGMITPSQIPHYLTADQARMILTHLPPNISPADALKSLTDQGHIIQGVNDWNYLSGTPTSSSVDTSSNQPQQSLTEKIGSGILGLGKSLVQPFTEAVGTGLRGIQSMGHFLKTGFQSGNPDIQGSLDIMKQPILGENTFAGNTNEQNLGEAAKAGSFLAGALPGGPTLEGAVGGGLFGAGQAASENASGAGVLGSAAIGTAGGAILGKLGGSIAKFGGRGENAAYNAALDTIKQQTAAWEAAGKTLGEDTAKLASDNPEAVINLGKNVTPETTNLINKFSAADIPQELKNKIADDMTTASVQDISSNINQLRNQVRSDTAKDALDSLNRDFRSWAQTSFNNIKPGLGDDLEAAFAKSKKVFQGFNKLNDVFGPNKNPGNDDVNSLINYVKQQMKDPTSKIGLQKSIQEWAQTSGIDLSNNVKLMQYTNTLKPMAKKAFMGVLKYGLGLVGLHELKNYIP